MNAPIDPEREKEIIVLKKYLKKSGITRFKKVLGLLKLLSLKETVVNNLKDKSKSLLPIFINLIEIL